MPLASAVAAVSCTLGFWIVPCWDTLHSLIVQSAPPAPVEPRLLSCCQAGLRGRHSQLTCFRTSAEHAKRAIGSGDAAASQRRYPLYAFIRNRLTTAVQGSSATVGSSPSCQL